SRSSKVLKARKAKPSTTSSSKSGSLLFLRGRGGLVRTIGTLSSQLSSEAFPLSEISALIFRALSRRLRLLLAFSSILLHIALFSAPPTSLHNMRLTLHNLNTHLTHFDTK
ncbi:hypothetical protein OTU49_010369, partial [Cherax quadricarinatus]